MKKTGLTIDDLFNIPNAEIFGHDNLDIISAVSADSRKVTKNSLFVAIKGPNFDGHDFIADAVKKGASAVMINRNMTGSVDKIKVPVVVVDDTVKGLGVLASVWRKKLAARVIAITGSAGKTTTKEMLAAVLGQKFKVNKTTGNNNNHIGVPFTILDTNESYEILIAELGTNHFGEIKYTAEIAMPDYALITNIGHSHLEFLKDVKGVIKEKGILFDVTAANGGFIFVNTDDSQIRKYALNFTRKMTYGQKGNPDVKGEILGYNESGNAEVEIKYNDKKLKILLPVPGEQTAMNFFAVCAVAFRFGMKPDEIAKGIAKFSGAEKRLNVKKKKGYILLDDSYNANPDSMKYSINLLSKYEDRKKIAVLGDMFELGEEAAELHKKLAKVIYRSGIDEVLLIGKLMENLFTELTAKNVKSSYFTDRKALKIFLGKFELNNTVVLVKGSRGMKMEEFVEVLEGRK